MSDSGMFDDGDRVTRPVDVFDESSPLLHGVVTMRYDQDGGCDGIHWHDPEVYEVRWDSGVVRRGFFRHGLDLERRALVELAPPKAGT